RGMLRVGIGEKEPRACSLLHADPKGVIFAYQPSGKLFVSRRRRLATSFIQPRTISPVASEDWSLTTRICPISGCPASDSRQAAMTASSLRAGTMAVTMSGRGAIPGCFIADRLELSLAISVFVGCGRSVSDAAKMRYHHT